MSDCPEVNSLTFLLKQIGTMTKYLYLRKPWILDLSFSNWYSTLRHINVENHRFATRVTWIVHQFITGKIHRYTKSWKILCLIEFHSLFEIYDGRTISRAKRITKFQTRMKFNSGIFLYTKCTNTHLANEGKFYQIEIFFSRFHLRWIFSPMKTRSLDDERNVEKMIV